MKAYDLLYKMHREQPRDTAFANFYPVALQPRDAATPTPYTPEEYDEPWRIVGTQTIDGVDTWGFSQKRFKDRHKGTAVPKLKNYLNYTFKRLLELEKTNPGKHFFQSAAVDWICFNTGLQNVHQSDLIAIFQQYKQKQDARSEESRSDWVFKGCYAPNDKRYREKFGTDIPDIAWYSTDSRDYVFDVTYKLEKDVFDHLFERAKLRAGLPNAPDETVRIYLRGALELLIPKIKRNYKVAIPVYYVEEKRMQMLLPFVSASDSNDISCFLVERDDTNRV